MRLTLVFYLAAFAAIGTVQAAQPAPAQVLPSPNIITGEGNNYGNWRGPYDSGNIKDWNNLLQLHGLPGNISNAPYDFDFAGAIQAFQQFKADTPNQPTYWTWWLQNQNKVIPTGETREELTPPPATLPRMEGEYTYHRLAQAFYLQSQSNPPLTSDQLEDGLRELAYSNSPRQRDAIRTLVRLITNTKGVDAAWSEMDRLQHDPVTQQAYPYVEDQRFIIMDKGWWSNVPFTAELREKMLVWLLAVVEGKDTLDKNLPHQVRTILEQQRLNDAIAQLNLYLVSDSNPLDWWLDADRTKPDSPHLWMDVNLGMPDSPRLTALKKIISGNNLLAFMQVNQTKRLTPQELLYNQDTPFWSQTARLAAFSYQQYTSGKGQEWLLLAAELARPNQPEFQAILVDATTALQDGMYLNTAPALQARLWQAVIWRHAEARKLSDLLPLLGMEQVRNLNVPSNEYQTYGFLSSTITNLTNWYIHQGDYVSARKVAAVMTPYQLKEDHTAQVNQVILAQTPEELYLALSHLTEVQDDAITPVFNMLSKNTLNSLLQSQKATFSPANRLALIRMVATRAWLSNDKKLLEESALMLHASQQGGDAEILAAVEGDDTQRLYYILTHPRMKPTLPIINDGWGYGELTDKAIDTYNHNDNNWWCSYKPNENTEGLEYAWARVEQPDWSEKAPLPPQYAEARKKAIAAHPIMKLVDAKEQQAIAAIPQAPQYLSEKVLALNTSGSLWGLWPFADKRIPAILHYAVRTTRYGCERDGSHEVYSKKAFEALHRNYPLSIWTKATPYWFD